MSDHGLETPEARIAQRQAAMAGLDERAVRFEAMKLAVFPNVGGDDPVKTAARMARFILTGEVAPVADERHAS